MSRWVEKHRYWLIGLGLFAVLFLFAAGCGKKDDSSSGSKLKDPAASVGEEESSGKSGDTSSTSASTTPTPGTMPGAMPGGMPMMPGGMPGMPGGMPGMPGMPGMGGAGAGAATASANPAEPTIPFKSVVSGASVLAVKNPDKSVNKFLKFKYRTNAKLVINVVLPAEMQSQKLSKDGWNTLFQVFSTDYEAKLAQMEKDNPVVASTSTTGGGMPGGMPGMPGGMPGMMMPGGLPAMPGMSAPPGM